MKSLLTLVLMCLVLTVGTALAEKSGNEKEVLKTEIASSDALSVMIFDTLYVAEKTSDVVAVFKSPIQAGKEHKGFRLKVYHPPALTASKNLFSYSKRL